jgi:cytochrome c biogenesis protein ResB
MLTAAVLLAMVHFAAGCVGQSRSLVRSQNVSSLHAEKIVQVTLASGEVVRFDQKGAHYYEQYNNRTRVVIGRTMAGNGVTIPVEQVREALVERIVNDESNVDVFPAVVITGLLVATVVSGAQR